MCVWYTMYIHIYIYTYVYIYIYIYTPTSSVHALRIVCKVCGLGLVRGLGFVRGSAQYVHVGFNRVTVTAAIGKSSCWWHKYQNKCTRVDVASIQRAQRYGTRATITHVDKWYVRYLK